MYHHTKYTPIFPLFFNLTCLVTCFVENSCTDDGGAWAETLISPESNRTTYILDGFLPVHDTAKRPNNTDNIDFLQCDCRYQEGVFLVEAMIFAIDQINQRTDVLAHVDLGYRIVGSCDIPSENAYFALEEYTRMEWNVLTVDDNDQEKSAIGVIGPGSSTGSTPLAFVLNTHGTPVISYGGTVTSWSKRSRFPNLFRTAFSDDKEAEALADLCSRFNWTYMAAVGSRDDVGSEGVKSFKRAINSKNACVSSESYIDEEADDSRLYSVIQTLKNKRKEGSVVNVAMLFMEWRYAQTLLKQANALQLANMTWLGVDHWTGDSGMTYLMPDDYLPAPFTRGTISTQFSSGYIRPFTEYLTENLSDRMQRNKWLMYFYCDQCFPDFRYSTMKNVTCTVQLASSKTCTEKVRLEEILQRQRRISNVVSAVYAAAHALDALLKWNMSNTSKSNEMAYTDYDGILDLLGSVNFTYQIGDYRSGEITFDGDGDLNRAQFDIVNFYQSNPNSSWQPAAVQRVGCWEKGEGENLWLNWSMIQWQTDNGINRPPVSYCHRPCEPGERMVNGTSACCWNCELCPIRTFSAIRNARACLPCPAHTHSNRARTVCLPNTLIWIDYTDTVGIVCMTLCIVGEIFTALAAFICCFAPHRQRSFVMGERYSMKTVVFINFAFGYCYVLVMLARPTVRNCTLRLVTWQWLAASNLLAKFFMLPRGRKTAANFAKLLGLSLDPGGRGWTCEMSYGVVVALAMAVYIVLAILVPPEIKRADLETGRGGQPTESMLFCSPNSVVTVLTIILLGGFWLLNLLTSYKLYRKIRKWRPPGIPKRTAEEFHIGNMVWSGYLVVLVFTVIVPLYLTTDDPWSQAVFALFTPFVILTLLLTIFASPRCWHVLRAAYTETDSRESSTSLPFLVSTANSLRDSLKTDETTTRQL